MRLISEPLGSVSIQVVASVVTIAHQQQFVARGQQVSPLLCYHPIEDEPENGLLLEGVDLRLDLNTVKTVTILMSDGRPPKDARAVSTPLFSVRCCHGKIYSRIGQCEILCMTISQLSILELFDMNFMADYTRARPLF